MGTFLNKFDTLLTKHDAYKTELNILQLNVFHIKLETLQENWDNSFFKGKFGITFLKILNSPTPIYIIANHILLEIEWSIVDTLFEIVYILSFSLEVAAFFYSKVCFKTLLLLKIESFIKFPGVCSLIISSE